MDQITNSSTPTDLAAGNDEINDKRTEAASRISSFIIAKSWLKRCQEYNEINARVNEFLLKCQVADDILKSKKSRYYEMREENEELTCQLRLAENQSNVIKQSVQRLSCKNNFLEIRKKKLLEKFNIRCDECIETNMEISAAKLQMMEVLENNQKLEVEIEKEKLNVEDFGEAGDRLTDELIQIKARCAENEEKLLQCMEEVEFEVNRSKSEKIELMKKLTKLKRFIDEYENIKFNKSGLSIEMEKSLLTKQAAILRESWEQSLENKLRRHMPIILFIMFEGLKVILPAIPSNSFVDFKVF